VLQTPAGVLTDRIGAHAMLVGGLLCSALALGLAALVPSFWFMIAMFGIAGIGNTVYHPAEYSILSRRVSARRIGSAYSVHTFSGMLGGAVAPATLLLLEHQFGWRGAFLSATLLGGAVAAMLAVERDALNASAGRPGPDRTRSQGGRRNARWRLLTSEPLLRNLVLFVLLALTGSGLQNYTVVGLAALHGTPLAIADAALTGHLLLIALGVLIGGLVAARVTRHDAVAAIGLAAVAVVIVPVAMLDPGPVLLIAMMSLAGLFSGLIMPSRDMIVRAMAPPGAFGTVFGFVSTGFNIGGIIAPLLFGWFMDHGHPREIFLLSAAFSLISILVLAIGRRRVEVEELA